MERPEPAEPEASVSSEGGNSGKSIHIGLIQRALDKMGYRTMLLVERKL